MAGIEPGALVELVRSAVDRAWNRTPAKALLRSPEELVTETLRALAELADEVIEDDRAAEALVRAVLGREALAPGETVHRREVGS